MTDSLILPRSEVQILGRSGAYDHVDVVYPRRLEALHVRADGVNARSQSVKSIATSGAALGGLDLASVLALAAWTVAPEIALPCGSSTFPETEPVLV